MIRSGAAALLALTVAACAGPVARPAIAPVVDPYPPATMRWLFGSGEGAAASASLYRSLARFVTTQGKAANSVVLAPDATLADPHFTACGDRPKAIVLDVDETILLNLGYEYHEAKNGGSFDPKVWDRWEQTGGNAVQAVPGAVEALSAIRSAGVKVIFNTNRAADHADATANTIEGAGLGPASHGDTLFLKGDDAGGNGKDGRRAKIASHYCVIAMVGDQLGDFSDLFAKAGDPAVRRGATLSPAIGGLWGNGWFMLPNPVYGSGLAGGYDDIFPADRRWTDTAGRKEQ